MNLQMLQILVSYDVSLMVVCLDYGQLHKEHRYNGVPLDNEYMRVTGEHF